MRTRIFTLLPVVMWLGVQAGGAQSPQRSLAIASSTFLLPTPAEPQGAAPASQDIAGEWNGALDVQGQKLRLVVHLKKNADGKLTGTLDSLDQGANNIPISAVEYAGGDVKLELSGIGAGYQGKLNAAGTEITGEWKQGDQTSITNYVNASTGAYAGFSSIATRESWTITPAGGIKTDFFGVTAGNGGPRAITEKRAGTISLSADGVILQIVSEKGSPTRYVVRGWLDGASGTVLKLNGPFYDQIDPKILADPHYGWNLDSLWVRKPRR